MTTEVDRDWIERQLAASPPLTEQQKADLRRVLTPTAAQPLAVRKSA